MQEWSVETKTYLSGDLTPQVQLSVDLTGGALGGDGDLLLLDVNLQAGSVNLGDIDDQQQTVRTLGPVDGNGALAMQPK